MEEKAEIKFRAFKKWLIQQDGGHGINDEEILDKLLYDAGFAITVDSKSRSFKIYGRSDDKPIPS